MAQRRDGQGQSFGISEGSKVTLGPRKGCDERMAGNQAQGEAQPRGMWRELPGTRLPMQLDVVALITSVLINNYNAIGLFLLLLTVDSLTGSDSSVALEPDLVERITSTPYRHSF